MSRPVILLVEDEQDLLTILATAIARSMPTYEVVSLASLGEAHGCLAGLEASGTRLACALVDHVVAGPVAPDDEPQNGVELLEQIRRSFPDASTFLFTGRALPNVEARARATGARVLWKPMRLKTLLGEVEDALAS